MKRQQFTIPQQFTVGDIKIDTKAQLDRKYTRLLLDAFVPYQEAMLAYLDELLAKHDPQLVERQLGEVRKQSKKKATEEEQMVLQFSQADASEQKKILGRMQDIWNEENALHQINRELREKLDIETRSQTILHHKRENIMKLLQGRQEMIEEDTWEKIGGKDKMSLVVSLIGDDSIGFGFSKIRLQASPINDIYDWMTQYHPDVLPLGDPFPTPPPPKKVTVPEKKELPHKLKTEFLTVPDSVTANLRTFLAMKRPGYTLISLLERSHDGKRAWLALLTRKLHDDTVDQVSDMIIELEPTKYMAIQNVQDTPASQQSPDPHVPS
jgi:hypothetical protein